MPVAKIQRQASINPTVLVVDDDPGTRFLVTESLYPHGFTVKEAATGEQALTLYPSVKPDLVLLDVNMPGIDGFETCLKIRNRRDGRDVPILVITGRDDSASIDAAYSAGASDFIVKPINWPVLIHHVRYMLRAGKALSEQHRNTQLQTLTHALSELASQFFLTLPEMLASALRIIAGSDYLSNDGVEAAIFLFKEDKFVLAANSAKDSTISAIADSYRNLTEPEVNTEGQLLFPLFVTATNRSPASLLDLQRYHHFSVSGSHIPESPSNADDLIGILVIKPRNPESTLKYSLGAFAPLIDELTHLICNAQAQLELYLTAQVFANSIEGIAITDADTRILRVNSAFEKITGYPARDVLNKPIGILKSGRQDAGFYRDMWRSIRQDGHWQGEIWNRRKDGEIYAEWLNVSAIKNTSGDVTHYMGIFIDISRQKEQERQLQHLTQLDNLTGLTNRFLFEEYLNHAVIEADTQNCSLAILCIDLDRFQHINETFGHAYGDQLLAVIAHRIRACLPGDALVTRRGGDEFLVLLKGFPHEASSVRRQLAKIAENLLQTVQLPLNIDRHKLSISASIGIALFPEHSEEASDLLKLADVAMYQAKEKGKNRYQFYLPAVSINTMASFTLESALYRAIENNELALFYQPQTDLGNGRIVGAEALLRWKHPQVGYIEPMGFIPLAEETQYIVEIGQWVLNTVCKQINAWEARGLFLKSGLQYIAVNISPQQCRQMDFVQCINRIILQSALNTPSRLELELTERCLMPNFEESIQMLTQLRALGLRLSIDDFGTGYSILSYLKDFPLDALKIDQSFIKSCTDNAGNAAMVRAIIAMASGLGLATIAEGVETDEQLQFLRDNACNRYQGYYQSKPLPIEEFEALMTNTNDPYSIHGVAD